MVGRTEDISDNYSARCSMILLGSEKVCSSSELRFCKYQRGASAQGCVSCLWQNNWARTTASRSLLLAYMPQISLSGMAIGNTVSVIIRRYSTGWFTDPARNRTVRAVFFTSTFSVEATQFNLMWDVAPWVGDDFLDIQSQLTSASGRE